MRVIVEKYGLELVAIIASFFVPIAGAILYCSFLVLGDLVTALIRGKKELGKDFEIKSRGLFQTFAKLVIYWIGLIVAQGTMTVFEFDIDLVKTILAGIAFIEVKSMDENMKAVLGYSIFGKILGLLRRNKDVYQEALEEKASKGK